ncbi:transcriptional regulator, GntR family [Hydrobacter penzbergensis]|uniref:Transcriptional regulator, GntR family n=1 Tax=Hydrobacter penzbergensis TaxID=1235997 RepID=A0A8X8IBL8_9BACT|nr:GntR family transcriptional regulator [Hydrobacter penzbergensis]SDW73849.1 transcriptional regulator, GntR family [Hydrobacter penzbergensis]
MSSENIYNVVRIDEQSITPKYLQLTNSVLQAIEEGKIEKDYLLPSINEMSYELEISRDTAEKAYKQLKSLGIIGSVPGKGYFVTKTDYKQTIKVFLLFNKLSYHKKIIYDSFVATLGEQAMIDFYIYNNDFPLFKKLLQNRKGDYTHYVIIPHFLEGGENAAQLINELPAGRLILMDKLIDGINNKFGAVYEHFESDIFQALREALPKLEKYDTIKIIFPAYTYFPEEILLGFHSFCSEYAFAHKVVHEIAKEPIQEGEVYINLMEDDLVVLLDKIQQTKLEVGKNVGIISYNETPWKRFILNGITTISTDFVKMGEIAAKLVLNNERTKMAVPFSINLRNSL